MVAILLVSEYLNESHDLNQGRPVKTLLGKALRLLASPIRYSVRYELRRRPPSHFIPDIGRELQRRATESTATYVQQRMAGVDSVSSDQDLITMAMGRVDQANDLLVCEFGVFSGRTINHIASLTQSKVYGFDSFEGLPERWRDGFSKGHFKVEALPKVRPNVSLIKGLFDQTLPQFVADHHKAVGFLHIDCDLYSSTKTIFSALAPLIRPGCIIVFDEYFNYPGWEDGEHKAFMEFMANSGLGFEYIGYNRLHEQVAVKITD